jgi:hypothetical protein
MAPTKDQTIKKLPIPPPSINFHSIFFSSEGGRKRHVFFVFSLDIGFWYLPSMLDAQILAVFSASQGNSQSNWRAMQGYWRSEDVWNFEFDCRMC